MALEFLASAGVAIDVLKKIVDLWDKGQAHEDQLNASIRADLVELVEELRKTHTTLVKLISPLRRIADDPATFADQFRAFFFDFRDAVDAFDFGEARMHCHKIEQIKNRMQKRKPRFGTDALWNQFYAILTMLSVGDLTIIDRQFKPFMQQFDQTVTRIYSQVEANAIAQALAEKKAFVASIGPEFAQNKALLEEMNDLIGKLTARM